MTQTNENEIIALITAVGGDLAQSVIKALRLVDKKITFVGTDITPRTTGDFYCSSTYQVPVASSPLYADALASIIKQHRCHIVVPCSEAEIRQLLHLAPNQMFTGAQVISQLAAIFEQLGDKLKLMETLYSKNVPLAPFADGKSQEKVKCLLEQTTFPLIAKERFSSGSKGIAICKNESELFQAIQTMKHPLVQGYIDDTYGEYSLGAYKSDRGLELITFRRLLGPVGATWHAELIRDSEIEEYARTICSSLDFKGSINIQVRKSTSGPLLLEINPRFSSLVAARAYCGFNDAWWSIADALQIERHFSWTSPSRFIFKRFFHEAVLTEETERFMLPPEWLPLEIGRD